MISANSMSSKAINYDIINAINRKHQRINIAPIDEFIQNGQEINKLIQTTSPSAVLGNLVILGYVSAVESYLRAIFRDLILIDEISKYHCESVQISYGSVLTNHKNNLPEALFEDKSLAGRKNIFESMKSFLGLSIQESNISNDLNDTLLLFNEICELRHCVVHRFGKFGSKNAIKLGLTRFSSCVEKPISCDYSSLQNIISICSNTVKLINNFLFLKILERISKDHPIIKIRKITGDYIKDKDLFKQYYEIFYSKTIPPAPATSLKKTYGLYCIHAKSKGYF